MNIKPTDNEQIILGIESSCDETSVAIVRDGREILGLATYSQLVEHEPFQGVVPEIAARHHLLKINPLLDEALSQAGVTLHQLDAIAVADRPGLVGALLMGVMTAKTLAFVLEKPLIPVNHVEAHIYAACFEQDPVFPTVSLVVSGGHTILYYSKTITDHTMIGTTIDDAVGEAFDKIAKFLGLGHPGGPALDNVAEKGDPLAYAFPSVTFKKEGYDYHFSFSGLKTSLIYLVKGMQEKGEPYSIPDLCASFRKTAIDGLYEKAKACCTRFATPHLIVAGGVAQNRYLRTRFLSDSDWQCTIPPGNLCGDNGAMIAGMGYHLHQQGIQADYRLSPSSRIVQKGRRGEVWMVDST